MRAILIDAENKSLKEVQITDLNSIYKTLRVNLIETAMYIDKKNLIYVDEEGLYGNTDNWFNYGDNIQPFVGNGLIIGVGRNGSTKDCTLSVKDAISNIKFLNREEVAKYGF